MVITMVPMRVMELPLTQIINVITMWNSIMSTFFMPTCTTDWSTTLRILATHSNDMFVIVSLVICMQMTIMQVIEMIIMFYRLMPTMLTVDVGVC